MNRIFRKLMVPALLVAAFLVVPLHAQYAFVLFNTTLNGVVTTTQTAITLTSATSQAVGAAATTAPAVGQNMFVDQELMLITAINGNVVTVQRGGVAGTDQQPHATLSTVLIGPQDRFFQMDPPSSNFGRTCAVGTAPQPWVNVANGNYWMCRGGIWTATNPIAITYNSVSLLL